MASSAQRGTVLVVDDDDLVARAARRILTRAGFRVLQASTAAQAWNEYAGAAEGLSLVLTDYSLPDGDGCELAGRIRAQQGTLPIVLMTGWSSAGSDDVRVDAVLTKPFDREGLLGAVNDAVGAAGTSERTGG